MDSSRVCNEGVCLICLSDNPDHQEVIYSLFSELDKRGFRVYTVGLKQPKVADIEFGENNYFFDAPRRPGLTKKTFNYLLLKKIIKLVRSLDVKYIYFETIHVWNIVIAKALRADHVILEVIHDVLPHDGSFLVKKATGLCAKYSHYVVLRNSKDLDLCSKTYGVPKDCILFLDSWRVFPDLCEPQYSGKFLFFGRLRKYKGLNALYSIALKCPDIDFIVRGSSDADSLDIVKKLAELPNVDIVEGYVTAEEMKKVFYEADWVLVPYESASQSGIIMDAYRFSRPVIAFEVGAISEQVKDKVTGCLVSSGDIDGFSAAIKEAYALDKTDFAQFVKDSYGFGFEKYSSCKGAGKFIELLCSISDK